MYRTAALLGVRSGLDLSNSTAFAQLVSRHEIDNRDGRTYLDGEDVSAAIRTPEATKNTRYAAENRGVRQQLIILQRREGTKRSLVTEGRDQGSVVFPNAFCKFYLTATPEARAKRRMKEWEQKGQSGDYDKILHDINERDRQDSTRAIDPLCQPKDAIVIDSSDKTIDQVLDEMESHLRNR